jgi:L-alanine-DL-glutamate epimerase-like enolase superfamily enzyme
VHIKTIEAIPVNLPMLKPVVMAGEEIHRADNVLVRIETDTGLVGWGEAASAPVMTGETMESICAAVCFMNPALTGRVAADIDGALAAMDGAMYGNTSAKAAIEIALHDLTGRATGQPVHALLGQKQRSRMALLGVIGGGDLDGDLRDAARKKTDGFTIFKIKVGIDTPAKDASRTRDICKILGAGSVISADANQGFSTEGAIDYVRAVKGAGLDFFEQPVMAYDVAGMAAVAAAAPEVEIGADEGIHSLDDITRHHERKAARGVSLKAIKLGGLRGLTAAGRLCGDLGMRVNVSCKTGESSVACAAALHVAAVIPNIAWGLTLTHSALAQDVTAQPVHILNGHADALDRPGLGIEVDEDRVRHHRTTTSMRRVA